MIGFVSDAIVLEMIALALLCSLLLFIHAQKDSNMLTFCSDLPICELDNKPPEHRVDKFIAFEDLRNRKVAMIGGVFLFELFEGIVNIISDDEIAVKHDQRSQSIRIGPALLLFSDIQSQSDFNHFTHTKLRRFPFQKFDIVIMSMDKSLQKDSVQNMVEIINELNPNVPMLFISRASVPLNDSRCKQEETDAITELSALSLNNLRIAQIGSHASDFNAETCSNSKSFITQASVALLDTFVFLYKPKPVSRGQISLLFFFTPLLFLIAALECVILFKSFSTQPKLFDPLPDYSMESAVFEEIENGSNSDSVLSEFHSKPQLSFKRIAEQLYDWYSSSGRKAGLSVLIYAAVLAFSYIQNEVSLPGVHFRLRDHSFDGFLSSMVLVVLASLLKIHQIEEHGGPKILHREQTEEWKGIMQIGFLLYHYYHTSEAYNAIRLFIASYVWMTGFGNFLYFTKKQDFTLSRVIRMTLRINLFVVFLTLAMDNEYMLYYICPLHTFFFFWVYLTLCPLKVFKVFDTPSQTQSRWIIFLLAISFVCSLLIFEYQSVFLTVFRFFPFLYLNNSLHEWNFRSSLDHYAVWWGMCVAFLLPLWVSLQRRLDTERTAKRLYFGSLVVITCISVIAVYTINLLTIEDKFQYNAIHPYVSMFPVTAFIVLRNISPSLRERFLFPLSWIGKITLETYLLQFHLWLADDAKSVPTYFESFPVLNFIFSSILYLSCAYAVFLATNHLIDLLVPNKASEHQVALRTFILVGSLSLCFAVSSAVV